MASRFAHHLHQSCSLGKKNQEVGLSPHIPLEVVHVQAAAEGGERHQVWMTTSGAFAAALSSCLLFLVSRPRRSHWSSSNVRSSSNWGGLSQRIFWKFPAEGFIPPSAFEAERHIETDWGKPFYLDSDLLLYRLLGSYLVILVFLENIWILIVIIKWQKGEFLVWDFWFILNQDFLVQTIFV